MIVPVLKKESTVAELATLCWLLNEARNGCEDSNLRWRIAQLSGKAEALHEKFLEDFKLFALQPLKNYKVMLEKLSTSDRTETLLSFAFQSASIIDSAHYEEIEPGKEFKNKIKSITKETLHLLHEKRGWRNEAD
ncbi:MAG: hypothetical protein ABI723_27365 [Bacteroidia bacterium]